MAWFQFKKKKTTSAHRRQSIRQHKTRAVHKRNALTRSSPSIWEQIGSVARRLASAMTIVFAFLPSAHAVVIDNAKSPDPCRDSHTGTAVAKRSTAQRESSFIIDDVTRRSTLAAAQDLRGRPKVKETSATMIVATISSRDSTPAKPKLRTAQLREKRLYRSPSAIEPRTVRKTVAKQRLAQEYRRRSASDVTLTGASRKPNGFSNVFKAPTLFSNWQYWSLALAYTKPRRNDNHIFYSKMLDRLIVYSLAMHDWQQKHKLSDTRERSEIHRERTRLDNQLVAFDGLFHQMRTVPCEETAFKFSDCVWRLQTQIERDYVSDASSKHEAEWIRLRAIYKQTGRRAKSQWPPITRFQNDLGSEQHGGLSFV